MIENLHPQTQGRRMAAQTRNQGQDLKYDRTSSETEKFEIINASVATTSNVEDFLQPNIQ
jgi:hypothetical protein